MRQLIEKHFEPSAKKLIKIRIIGSGIILPIAAYMVVSAHPNSKWYDVKLVIAVGLLAIFLLLLRWINSKVVQLVYEHLAFEEYIKYYQLFEKGPFFKKINGFAKKWAEAEVKFYLGEFEQSLEIVETISLEKISSKSQRSRDVRYIILNLRFQNQMALGQVIDIEQYLQDVRSCRAKLPVMLKRQHHGQALYDLLVQEIPNDYFELATPASRLQKLMYTYYRGIKRE